MASKNSWKLVLALKRSRRQKGIEIANSNTVKSPISHTISAPKQQQTSTHL